MTTIEVIDTAIKIGLGALITAFVTLVVTRSNQTHELRKERLSPKRLLDERIIKKKLECCKVRLELYGRLTNQYNGFNQKKVPKAYEWRNRMLPILITSFS
jgi:hypothetical protein